MTFKPVNELLAQLEPTVAVRMAQRFERLSPRRGDILQESGAEIDWVWFPETVLISMTSESIDGDTVSAGILGRDGTLGAFEACGSRLSYVRARVQIAGDAWRIRAAHYRDLFHASANLRTAIHKYIESLLVEARQLIACTALHRVEMRMCRILLDASERSHSGTHLTLTQEEVANMLGVQRSTIAVASSALQRSGLIVSRRGSIDILDHQRLEAAACSCRRSIAYAQQEIAGTPEQVCEA